MTIVAKAGTIPHLHHDGKGSTGPDGPVVGAKVQCLSCYMPQLMYFVYTVFHTWECPYCLARNAWWPHVEGANFYIGFFR